MTDDTKADVTQSSGTDVTTQTPPTPQPEASASPAAAVPADPSAGLSERLEAYESVVGAALSELKARVDKLETDAKTPSQAPAAVAEPPPYIGAQVFYCGDTSGGTHVHPAIISGTYAKEGEDAGLDDDRADLTVFFRGSAPAFRGSRSRKDGQWGFQRMSEPNASVKGA